MLFLLGGGGKGGKKKKIHEQTSTSSTMKRTKPRKTHLLTKIMKLLTTPHRADCNGSKNLSRHVVRYTSFSYPILTGMEREVQIAKPNTGPRPASSIPIKQLSCAQLGAPEDAVTMAFCCQ
jgi:hypothetical protein